MHPADTAGREYVNANAMRDPQSRGDRRGSVPATRYRNRQIARANLFDVVVIADTFDLILVKTNTQLSLEHRNRRRACSFIAHDSFKASGSFQIPWPRQTVSDHS